MRTILLMLLTLLACPGFSQVHSTTLDNGLKIVVKEDHRAPVAVSMLWYKVGSADEIGGMTGLSHALEHMMFKGTKAYPQGVFSKTIASLGGVENAFTGSDYTAYFEKIAASKLPVVLALEADRMRNLLLRPEDFAKEIKVIQEERRLRTDDIPQALAFERFLATAHLTPPYQHPVIGWMADLKQMRVETLRAWYAQYYTPNNATLVVVGDVTPDAVFALAKQAFGAIKSQPVALRLPQTEPPTLGEKKVTIKAPAKLPLLMLGYPVPGVKTAKIAWEPYALEVIGGILDAGDNARLTKNVIRKSRIASGVDVKYSLYTRYPTDFILYGVPSLSHTTSELKPLLLQEIQRLKEQLVPKEELQRIKMQIIAQKTFEKDTVFGQAIELGMTETLGLGFARADSYSEAILQITPEQIQQTARHYFKDKALTVATLLPTAFVAENPGVTP